MKINLVQKQPDFKVFEEIETTVECPHCHDVNCGGIILVERENTDPVSEYVYEKKSENYLCKVCGYTTNSSLENETESLQKALAGSPMIVRDLKLFDIGRNLYWLPSVLNIKNVAIIYPEGSVSNWEWVVSPYKKLSEEELEEYKGKYEKEPTFTHKLSIEDSKKFSMTRFFDAMNYLIGLSTVEN